MISIIICSVNNLLYGELVKNIKKTIGLLPYEIVKIENAILQLSMAKAYNMGIKRSQFPYLLFLHEDILFHTTDWGLLIKNYFDANLEAGLIGVAGTKVKTNTPTGWWENKPENWVMNLIQHYADGKVEKIVRGFENENLSEAVIIDGVFIGMRKVDNIFFDERLTGFHNYDQSISLLYRSAGYKIYVTSEIVIEHFSIGQKGKSWLKSTFEFHNLYKRMLPQSVPEQKITSGHKSYSFSRVYRNVKQSRNHFFGLKYLLKGLYFDPISKENLFNLRSLFKRRKMRK